MPAFWHVYDNISRHWLAWTYAVAASMTSNAVPAFVMAKLQKIYSRKIGSVNGMKNPLDAIPMIYFLLCVKMLRFPAVARSVCHTPGYYFMIPFWMMMASELEYQTRLNTVVEKRMNQWNMFCYVVVRMKKQEWLCWIVSRIFSSLQKSRINQKLDILKVCCWFPTVKVTVLVEGRIYIVKKHCLNLLPALINEYNIPSITSYSTLPSSTCYTSEVYTFSDLYRSVDFSFYLWFHRDVNSARKGSTRSQQQQNVKERFK